MMAEEEKKRIKLDLRKVQEAQGIRKESTLEQVNKKFETDIVVGIQREKPIFQTVGLPKPKMSETDIIEPQKEFYGERKNLQKTRAIDKKGMEATEILNPKRKEIENGNLERDERETEDLEETKTKDAEKEDDETEIFGDQNNLKVYKKIRVPTGIRGLDNLIEGGFEKNASILLVGSTGTGKTLFALQFLYEGAVKYNEPGVFITFEETRENIYEHALDFGWNFRKLEEENKFRLLTYKPRQVERLMREGGGTIRDTIRKMGAKRLVIDSISAYNLLFHSEHETRENVLALFDLLRKWDITSIIVSESPAELSEIKEIDTGFLTDAIIALYYARKPGKDIRVH